MAKIRPTDIWNFGKHQGTPIQDLPRDYLKWVVKNFRPGPLRDAARRQLDSLQMNLFDNEDPFVQGRTDASHLHKPNAECSLAPWDGVSPPFDVDTVTAKPSSELFVGVA